MYVPLSAGKHVVSAKFTSKQLQDIDSYYQFMVQDEIEN